MSNRFFLYQFQHRALDAILQRPKTVILVIAIITFFFSWHIPNISFRTSIYDLVIEDLPETTTYENFRKLFGSDEIIRIVIRSKNVLDPVTFKKIKHIADAVSKVDGLRRVVSLPGIMKNIDVGGNWGLDKFAAILSPIKIFQNNLISKDRSTTAITLVLDTDTEKETVIGAIRNILNKAPKDLSLYQIGMPLVSEAMARYTERDFQLLPPITIFVMMVILLLLFSNIFLMLIPLATVLVTLIWTFGLMAWCQIPLSMLTMIVPVFLIAVGTAYCLHISSEFATSIKRLESLEEATRATFLIMTLPTTLAVITTVIALGSLLVNKTDAIREFALFACFGMISLLILTLTFFPAALSLIPSHRARRAGSTRAAQAAEWIGAKVAHINLTQQKIVLPLLGCVVLFSVIGIFRIRVETNPVAFFKQGTTISRNFHDIYQHLSGSFPVHVYVKSAGDDGFEDPGAIDEIARFQTFLEQLPGVDKSVSFADYLKLINYALNRFDPQYYRLPEEPFEVRMLFNNYKTMLGEDMLDRFLSPDFSEANILLLTHLSSSREFLEIKKEIQQHVKKHYLKTLSSDVTGYGIVVSASGHQLTAGQVKSLSITVVLVFSLMFLMFLSFKGGVVAIVPNLFPIVISFGIMGWLGIELSAVTSLIASIAIGLSVDDTIHYLVCYNREFKKVLDDELALRQTLKQIGRPILFTTLTITAGFSVLIFSSFGPTSMFGILMVITMISALVGDLILLPSLMLHVELVTLWDLLRVKLGADPQKGIPVFSGLPRSRIHHILMAGSLKPFKEGDVICRKGESSNLMYAIVSGTMEVINPLVEDQDGFFRQKVIARMKVGDVLGEMGFFRGAPRSATVIATAPGEVLQINWKMIKRLQLLYPITANRFFSNLVTLLCDRLDNLTQCYSAESFLDEATGLFNSRGFFEMLEREINLAHRHQMVFSLCFLEIDFKSSNHRMDYQTRESILNRVGKSIPMDLRKCDILGRLDFHVFGLILTQSSLEKAKEICSRMELHIKEKTMDKERHAIHVNRGVVEFDSKSDKSGADLTKRANEALKQFKIKNC
jgi:hypothetical protein